MIERLDARALDRALVIVTHVRREAELADRIVLVEGGRIVADAARGSEGFEELLGRLRPD